MIDWEAAALELCGGMESRVESIHRDKARAIVEAALGNEPLYSKQVIEERLFAGARIRVRVNEIQVWPEATP